MSDDETKLLQIHREFKSHGYADYSVEIRKSGSKRIVTIYAGKIFRFEISEVVD